MNRPTFQTMSNEYEIYTFFRRNAMPRQTDVLIQGLLIVVFFSIAYSIDLENFNAENGMGWWGVLFVLAWFGQNLLFRKILMRRAKRAESNFSDLPDGLFEKLANVSTPADTHVFCQVLAIAVFWETFYSGMHSQLSESMSSYFWIVVLLALWQIHLVFLRAVLRSRLVLAYYKGMYSETLKTATI